MAEKTDAEKKQDVSKISPAALSALSVADLVTKAEAEFWDVPKLQTALLIKIAQNSEK